MNTDDKLVAAAKRAARNLSRRDGVSYQRCLDLVAQQAGRPTWSAFLNQPVPVDADAVEAAAEPDFGAIPPADHALAIVRHGRRIEATAFLAHPRNWDDPSPMLTYTLTDGSAWPIDARGLSIESVAMACLPNAPLQRPHFGNGYYFHVDDMPVIGDALMRSVVHKNWNIGLELVGVSATIDGSAPVRVDLPVAPPAENTVADTASPATSWKPSLAQRTRRRAGLLLRGADALSVDTMIERGLLSRSEGPVVLTDPRGRHLRLRPGHNMCAFSPPGTGRIAGVCIPALVSDDRSSLVVHDDGQLVIYTSGWRAGLGPVAVIRIDEATNDTLNPFGAEWLPEPRHRLRYADSIATAITPSDPRIARLIADKAYQLISRDGETTLRKIHDELAATRDHPLTARALMELSPLVDMHGDAVTSRSSFTPDMLRYGERPMTVYVIRNPRISTGTRDRLAAIIQTAIWNAAIRGKPGEEASSRPRPLTTMIQDFHRMPRIPVMPEILEMARGFGLGSIITGNTVSTVAERYPDKPWVLQSMGHLNVLTTQSDADEHALIDQYGQIEWDEASTLGQGRCIALTGGGIPPARLRMPYFFEHQKLLQRTWNPRLHLGPKPVE